MASRYISFLLISDVSVLSTSQIINAMMRLPMISIVFFCVFLTAYCPGLAQSTVRCWNGTICAPTKYLSVQGATWPSNNSSVLTESITVEICCVYPCNNIACEFVIFPISYVLTRIYYVIYAHSCACTFPIELHSKDNNSIYPLDRTSKKFNADRLAESRSVVRCYFFHNSQIFVCISPSGTIILFSAKFVTYRCWPWFHRPPTTMCQCKKKPGTFFASWCACTIWVLFGFG